jgi:hypothetical protein
VGFEFQNATRGAFVAWAMWVTPARRSARDAPAGPGELLLGGQPERRRARKQKHERLHLTEQATFPADGPGLPCLTNLDRFGWAEHRRRSSFG